jgi:hypothetical protein
MNRFPAMTILAAALAAGGCTNLFSNQTTTPDPTNLSTGQWKSASPSTTLTDTCTNFSWQISTITTTNVSGSFAATCMTNVQMIGTAQGTISGDTMMWTASGTGAAPNVPSCAVTLNGTATYDGTQIRIPFTGTSCLGPVTGAEILRKS